MDLKFKGTTWVGNIYQKFEAMCQEIEDFLSQDEVRYVESQVHDVSRSVKKISSDVGQDFLSPPVVDTGKHEAQAVPQKQNDTVGTYTRSTIGAEEKPVDIDVKQSSVERDPIDPRENSYKPSSTRLCSVKHITPTPTEDPYKEADSGISLGKDGDALIYNNDMGIEENVMDERRSSLEDLSSPEDEGLSEVSLFCESIDENLNSGLMDKVLPATLVDDEGVRSSPEEGKLFKSFSDEVDFVSVVPSSLRSSELQFSIDSFDDEVVETALLSSSSSLSAELYNLSKYSSSCVSDLSGALFSKSFPGVACDNMDADMGLALSSSVSPTESNGHVDDSFIDIADPSLETIDLSDKVKFDESCVIVDSYYVSCRARKLRSYKKIIQEAFASRKRLTKEYEQLAIWYGDIDIESRQHPKENILLSIPAVSVKSKKSPSQDLCDSGWELL